MHNNYTNISVMVQYICARHNTLVMTQHMCMIYQHNSYDIICMHDIIYQSLWYYILALHNISVMVQYTCVVSHVIIYMHEINIGHDFDCREYVNTPYVRCKNA